jgi:hypothetical protein
VCGFQSFTMTSANTTRQNHPLEVLPPAAPSRGIVQSPGYAYRLPGTYLKEEFFRARPPY